MSFFRAVRLRRRAPWRTPWYRRRLPVWLRVLLTAAVVGTAMVCGQWVAVAYRDAVEFRRAPGCPAGLAVPAQDARCVASTTGSIGDKGTGQSCTGTDANNSQSCDTYYWVQLNYGGRTDRLDVSPDTYHLVVLGDPADLRTWHGALVWMKVRGRTERYGPPSEAAMDWRLVLIWLLVGLGMWSTVSGYLDELFAFPNFGWVWLAVPVSSIVHGVLLGASLWSWIWWSAFVAFDVWWTAGALRFSGRSGWYAGRPSRLPAWLRRGRRA